MHFDELARFVCSLMDPAPIGVLVLRPGYECVAANANVLARLPGGSVDLQRFSNELRLARHVDFDFQAAFDKACRGLVSSLETEHPPLLGSSQGQWRLLVLPFVVNDEHGVAVLFHDITEQRITTEAFHSAEQRFRRLVDAAADGIVIHREHVLLYVNSEAVHLLGYQATDELVGRTLGDLVDTEHRASFEGRLMEVMSSHGSSTFETAFVRPSGDSFPVECRASHAEVDDEGTGFLFFRDITERKRQQLRRDNTRRVDSLSRLSVAVGNELHGYAARLRRFALRLGDLPDKGASVELGQLTDELDERAAQFCLAAPASSLDNEPTSLEELLGRTCLRLREQLANADAVMGRHGEILIDFEPIEQAIRGDPTVIESALVTLAMAAWQSTSLELPLRICGTCAPKPDLETNACYRLTVAGGPAKGQSGTGRRVPTFPPTASPYSSWEQGRDLNLLAAFESLQLQGSSVEVQQGPTGVCFQVWLALETDWSPLVTTHSLGAEARVSTLQSLPSDAAELGPDTERSRPQAGPSATRARCPILICDDEARLVALTAGLLREFGFEVLTAKNGNEAVGIVSHNPVDVVVLDINLPGEDAFEIVERIQSVSRARVILSSGYTEEDVEPSLLKASIVRRFLSKPYAVDVLVQAIDAVRQEQSVVDPTS